jgi:DNA-directed RNA polymerase
MKEISFQRFIELHNKGYTLDMVYLLFLFRDNIDIRSMSSSARINEIISLLIRKGLLTEEDNITVEGEGLLKFMDNPGEEVKLVRKKTDDEFDLFWKVFPASDIFEYKGVKFTGSRALRINKEDCKVKLKAILNTGEFSINEIVEAVKYDVQCKMENSIKTKTNKLSYLQNSLTYLRQYSFLPFLELIKEGKVIKEETQKTFDGINI